MSEGRKDDQFKSALHLIPWKEFDVQDTRVSVEHAYAALKTWWCAKPFSLKEAFVPRGELEGIGRALEFGARKYAPRNWERGIAYSKIFSAACRHAEALARGERVAEDSGLPHENHFWCDYMFLVVFATRGRDLDLDDRPEPVPAVRASVDEWERRRDQNLANLASVLGVDLSASGTPKAGAN